MKKQRNIWKVVLAACILAVTMAGCGTKAVELDVDKAAADIKAAVTFQDTLSELAESRFETLYAVKQEDVDDWAIYVSTGATAEEIAVMEARDEAAAARVRTAIEQRIEDQKESFEDYVPAELVKLGSPVLEVRGRYVLLCICDDPAQARTAIEALFKQS